MNTALSDVSTTLEVPAATGSSPASVALYVDADNQSPQCAKPLLALLQGDLDARVVSATIAGNNHGQQVDSWRDELLSAVPDLTVHPLNAPHRKQGADVALLMALGADLEGHVRDRVLVVIVSRDDLVIAAAEQAKTRGCRTLIAYADGEIPTARNPQLATLLLPALARPIAVAHPPPVVIQPATPSSHAQPTVPKHNDGVASVLAQVRSLCKQKPGGGYAATDVGQALSKLGYDKAARARFLASVPGLKKQGTGPDVTLKF
jgi:hypothetical protein